MEEFNGRMDRLKAYNEDAWKHLAKFKPEQWTRAAFSTYTRNAAITNNMCEQFNSKIIKHRGKSIITMLEGIRLYIVSKMSTNRQLASKTKGLLCPKVKDKLEKAKIDSGKWLPTWMGDLDESVFEVECKPAKYKVNLKERTCSCREWDLTGIPCVHAISAIGWKNLRPEEYVHEYMRLDKWVKAYESFIQPLNGPNMWPNTGKELVHPPPIKRPAGRPKTRRKKDAVEAEIKSQDPTKARRRLIPTCSKCKQQGHNMRSCKGLPTSATAATGSQATGPKSGAGSQARARAAGGRSCRSATQLASQSDGGVNDKNKKKV